MAKLSDDDRRSRRLAALGRSLLIVLVEGHAVPDAVCSRRYRTSPTTSSGTSRPMARLSRRRR
jgi:hypothetical protein